MKRLLSLFLALLTVLSLSLIFVFDSAALGSQITNVVVFVRFSGDSTDTITENWTKIDAAFNDTSELNLNIGVSLDYSFKNYIHTVSRGNLTVTNYFPQESSGQVAQLTLSVTRAQCADDLTIVTEVMDAFNDGRLTLGSGKFDYVESEVLDCLTVIVQGDSGLDLDDEILYPHKAVCGSSDKINSRYYVRNYVMIDSENIISGMKQGVITHEFMHVLGFPDLYRTNGSSGAPVGRWDLMASVAPYMQYPLAYMRHTYGWVPMHEITGNGHYTLDAVSSNSDTVAYKIQTPMSDSEFFVLEFRKRKTDTVAGLGFETKIPTSGLLVYRVNNSVAERSNAAGRDYLYIFRPDETSLTESAGNLSGAAINPDEGETSYGTASFDDEFTSNTIFYSNGNNSGIVISNVAYNSDSTQISFDVTFPDYSSLDLWDKTGDAFGSELLGDIDMTVDENGNLYTAVLKAGDWDNSVGAYKWNGSSWAQLGGWFSNAYDQKIEVVGGVPYFAFCNSNGNPTVKKFNGSAWVNVATVTDAYYPASIDFATDGTNLYLTYVLDSSTLVIKKVEASSLSNVTTLPAAEEMYARHMITCHGGKIYAVFSYFGWSISEKRTIIESYDLSTGSWSPETVLEINNANTFSMHSDGDKLYVLAGVTNVSPIVACFDGNTWTHETITMPTSSYTNLFFDTAGGTPYLAYISSGNVCLMKKTDGVWALNTTVTSSCSDFELVIANGTAFVAAVSESNSNITVFTRTLYVPPVLVSSVTLSQTQVTKSVHYRFTLTASALPVNAANRSIIWSSSDENVAVVGQDGIVRVVGVGTAIITASAADSGGATAQCSVTGTEPEPATPSLKIFSYSDSFNVKVKWWKSYSSASLQLGTRLTDCYPSRVVWSSSSSKVQVSQSGFVTNTGSLARSAKITVTAYDALGNVLASDTVKVKFFKFV